MKRKSFVFISAVLTLLMLFSGVSYAANTSASSNKAVKLSGTLTIWSWGADAEKVARENTVKVFQKEHPELKIKHVILPTGGGVWDQKSAAAYAAGNAGDVMQTSPDYYGLMSKYYEDLRPYVKKENVNLNDVMIKGAMNGYYRPDGKLDSMPLLANCFLIAYNKNLFDKAGVPYPKDNWTWDDFEKMAPKFVSGTGIHHTYFMVNHWINGQMALLCKGGQPYDSKFTKALVNSKEVAAGLDLFGSLIKKGAIPSDTEAKNLPADQLFVSGRAALYPMGGMEIANVAKEIGSNFKWDAVLPPKSSPTGNNINLTFATGYAMNTASKNKNAAWQFIKEVSYANDDLAKEVAKSGMPVNKKIAETVYAKTTFGVVPAKKYVDGLATSHLNLWGGALAQAGDQWWQMWQYVTVKGKSAAEAQAKYYPLIEKAFKKLNIKN